MASTLDVPTTSSIRETRSTTVLDVTLWAGLIALTGILGAYLVARDPGIKLFAAPLFGRFDWRIGWGLPVAVAAAVPAIIFGSRIATRLPWRSLLIVAVVGAAGWAVVVASISGMDGLTDPLMHRADYIAAVDSVSSPTGFLDGFVANISTYPIHVQGHPPGMVLLLWAMNALGLGGEVWAAAVIVGAGASSVAAILITQREFRGEAAARRAAPFVVLSPLVIWIATSADALFAALGAWAICCTLLACRRTGTASAALALAGGLLLGVLLYLTYAGALIAGIAVAAVIAYRQPRVAMLAGLGIAAVAVAWTLAGFWWIDGWLATKERYQLGVAAERPYLFFLLVNLAALAVATGPAVAAGIRRLTWDVSWIPVLGALAAVAVATFSGFSKGEVERIWLPFALWIMLVASLAPGDGRRWLLAQVTWTLMVQTMVRTPW